ncbi:MAG: hypothetical protein IAF94_12615 [Pirellulaceae bacterium]|nr:hypothetical protein [Pirellulaceae bacterium]
MSAARAITISEQLIQRIVPDVAGVPLHVVQPKVMVGSVLAGFVHDRLCPIMRPELEAAGQWRGEGWTIAADIDHIFARDIPDSTAERLAVGLILHEAAHLLVSAAAPPADKPAPNSEPADDIAAFVAESQRALSDESPARIPAAFWGHGDRFTRVCCHLYFRYISGGNYRLYPKDLIFGNAYPTLDLLSDPGKYAWLLWDELGANRYCAFREIVPATLPEAFALQWQADASRVFDSALAARAAA